MFDFLVALKTAVEQIQRCSRRVPHLGERRNNREVVDDSARVRLPMQHGGPYLPRSSLRVYGNALTALRSSWMCAAFDIVWPATMVGSVYVGSGLPSAR